MKLFLISQDVNDGYDVYDSAVVAAESEEAARSIHPSRFYERLGNGWGFKYSSGEVKYEGEQTDCWCALDDVKVRCIGETETVQAGGVVCASFNAG